MSLIAWINWLACGPTEDFRYHVTSTGEDQLRGALVFFELSVITSGLLAAAKPACTSRVRCALVGAGIGFADGLVTVPLLLDRSALTGTGIAFAAGTAALGAIAGSAFLWDTARRGDAWRWPF